MSEKSSIKTLISNIPVKRKIKPIPVPSDPAPDTAANEEEVEIIKEVTKDKEDVTKTKGGEVTKGNDVTKAKESGQEKDKTSTSGEKAPSIKSFFSTIPVKRKAAEAVTSPESESQNGGLAKQTRSEEANKEEERDDQKES